MGVVLRTFARLLFVLLFIGAAVDKVTKPEGSAGYLSASYAPFHKWATNLQVVQKLNEVIPPEVRPHLALVQEWVSPAFVQDHSVALITYVGYFQLVASALVLLGVSIGGWALYAFTLSTIAIIHNPFVNPLTFHAEFVNALLNLAVAGVALFIASCPKQNACNSASATKSATPKPASEKKGSSVSKPPTKGRK